MMFDDVLMFSPSAARSAAAADEVSAKLASNLKLGESSSNGGGGHSVTDNDDEDDKHSSSRSEGKSRRK
eukprot:11773-Heterococcus_DN1.PRE.1